MGRGKAQESGIKDGAAKTKGPSFKTSNRWSDKRGISPGQIKARERQGFPEAKFMP